MMRECLNCHFELPQIRCPNCQFNFYIVTRESYEFLESGSYVPKTQIKEELLEKIDRLRQGLIENPLINEEVEANDNASIHNNALSQVKQIIEEA